MNTHQRKLLQERLDDMGFNLRRKSTDHGDGVHAEWWWHADGSTVKINWGPREEAVSVDA